MGGLINILEYGLDKNINNCYMCALYENYLFEDEEDIMYKSSTIPHCLAKHDVDKAGALIPDFDRLIARECHSPSYHKLLLIDSELREAVTLKEAHDIFIKKYINNTNK